MTAQRQKTTKTTITMATELKNKGMTLAEVMVAAAIFGLGLLGVFDMTRLIYRTSIDNVSDGIALQAAESLMEQVWSMPYGTVISPGGQAPTNLTFTRYQPPQSNGTPASQVQQTIPVNDNLYHVIDGITLATELDSDLRIKRDVPLDFQVKLTLSPNSENFANGTTVEIFYKYRLGQVEGYSERVLRAFIPRFIR